MSTKIRWTNEQFSSVIALAAKYFYLHPDCDENYKRRGRAKKEALVRAIQEVCPPDKQRAPSLNNIHALGEYVKKHPAQALLKEEGLITEPEHATAQATVQAEGSVGLDAEPSGPAAAAPETPPIDPAVMHAIGFIGGLKGLMGEIANIFADAVAIRLKEVIAATPVAAPQADTILKTARLPEESAHATAPLPQRVEPAPAPRPDAHLPARLQKKRALIISNRDKDIDIVRRRFPNIDIRFVHCDSSKQIETVSKNVDLTFVMVRWVGHGAQNHVYGKKILVPAGRSSLEALIERHLVYPARTNGGEGHSRAH